MQGEIAELRSVCCTLTILTGGKEEDEGRCLDMRGINQEVWREENYGRNGEKKCNANNKEQQDKFFFYNGILKIYENSKNIIDCWRGEEEERESVER